MNLRLRHTWLVIVLAGVMTIVLACGGADDEGEPATGPAAAAQPTPVPAMAAPADHGVRARQDGAGRGTQQHVQP